MCYPMRSSRLIIQMLITSVFNAAKRVVSQQLDSVTGIHASFRGCHPDRGVFQATIPACRNSDDS